MKITFNPGVERPLLSLKQVLNEQGLYRPVSPNETIHRILYSCGTGNKFVIIGEFGMTPFDTKFDDGGWDGIWFVKTDETVTIKG